MLERLRAFKERFQGASESSGSQSTGGTKWASAKSIKTPAVQQPPQSTGKRSFRGVGKESQFFSASFLSPFRQDLSLEPQPPSAPAPLHQFRRRSSASSMHQQQVDHMVQEAWQDVEVTWRVPTALAREPLATPSSTSRGSRIPSAQRLEASYEEENDVYDEQAARASFQEALLAWRSAKTKEVFEDRKQASLKASRAPSAMSLKRTNDRPESQNQETLLEGTYDEAASHQSFQQALLAWRRSASATTSRDNQPSMHAATQMTNKKKSAIPVEIKFQSTSSLSYFDRLLLQEYRLREKEQK